MCDSESTSDDYIDGLELILLRERPHGGVHRKRQQHIQDSALLEGVRWPEMLASKADLEALGEVPAVRYEIPNSGPVVLTNAGIPPDAVEDLLPESSAYRQASRVLLPKQRDVRGRPLTPLHGGNVGLLCSAGMLNGVFGEEKIVTSPTGGR